MSLMLSVIVPMHNVGELLEPFLASLLAQREQRLEVIIVNDGSTDGSGETAHRYAAAHPHIRVIDQANAGVSNARNAGLALAGQIRGVSRCRRSAGTGHVFHCWSRRSATN